ncbi:glycoside hydrolase family 2 protein [Enterococcus casseliflavus]|uniref:glycoside hydrolase family 2 protein n=1 Tax=Enterococcus casseliflavus TaxID=37734 RepID=UPI00177CC0CB|nr:glycoside hydrolase family 2 TIM barrel-domain containing protein [Enterococcus casseliflavus]QOG29427.1 glycoside hydrolase family 2 protein [Enterococcus casseliflavus]
MRTTTNLNANWKYKKNNLSISEVKNTFNEWIEINLPHTWNAIDGSNGNDYYRGVSWYVKELIISEDEIENRLFIEFEGSNSVTDVYVNDIHVGQHKGGYATFRFDITEQLFFGEKNNIAVKVDNAEYPEIYPLRADFTFYGGIYRDVNLISVNPLHFDLEDYGSSGIYIEQRDVTEKLAVLNITTKLKSKHIQKQKARLWIEVLNDQGQVITYQGKEVTIEKKQDTIETEVNLDNPILWSGQDSPYLYYLKVSLQQNNDTIDQLTIPFGVRYFKVDPEEGFFLNGKHLSLNGVSRHQDRKDKGWAISKENHREDMELIKEIGATSIRLAHYQHDPYFYDLCDQEGMIVWAEIPFITEVSRAENPEENAKQQLVELIRQNYNHPSIFFWGIQNEIQIDYGNDEVARKIVKNLNKLAKEEDSTRLTTMANVLTVQDTDEYNYITDIIGFNKYYGWYMGKPEEFAEWIDQYHEINPNTPLSISEYGAEGIIEYHSNDPKVKDYTEEYHALFHEKVWDIFSKRNFLWATYVWNMFDFGANIRDEGGVKGRNNKGLITYDRQVKKDAFYMYKAHWSNEPFVHITGKRYIERSGDTISIKLYTNCDEVTLTVNNEEVETIKVENKIIEFKDISIKADMNLVEVTAIKEEKTFKDEAYFIKVTDEPEYYKAPVDNVGENVQNWFEIPEIDESEENVEVIIPEGVYSSRDTLEELMSVEEARQVVIEVMGDLTVIPMYGMMKNMTVDTLAKMDQESAMFNKARINKLNENLTKIQKLAKIKK